MIKSPIPLASEKLQFRAIGIIYGTFIAINPHCLNKGRIIDKDGFQIDVVVLGKALPILKKFVNFEKQYFWIVYPRNKNTECLHLQIAGIWDPNNFKEERISKFEESNKILSSINLKDNLFSIRGKLVFINVAQEEIIIKICTFNTNKNQTKSFKVTLKGLIPMQFINSFVSIDAYRKSNTLYLDKFEIIEDKSFEIK
tara:strand:- start:10374 stop:10967 length:594 start_codon:yes stop_codon:yes gene_type:complete